MSLPKKIEEVRLDDDILVLRDGCYHSVKYHHLVKPILEMFVLAMREELLNNACEYYQALERCMPKEEPQEFPKDNNIYFRDLDIVLENRVRNSSISEALFLSRYYSPNGSKIKDIVIIGGDTNGFTYKNKPIQIGQVIPFDNISSLRYNADDTDREYIQELEIEIYDINGQKAI